ncbi:SLC13 family permease [Rothia aerolata]|uniref:Transporter n=1 Tax=Rothia aerolata TaxID=1812262 RepID=A0A917IUG8_9MICC|nr:SLC13 family permease [Rothia aerolata]GGH63896.1 transporter [Rothia aerolata]
MNQLKNSSAGSTLTAKAEAGQRRPSDIPTALVVSAAAATALVILIALAGFGQTTLSVEAALTLSIFVVAVWAWVFSPLPDTYVALAAAVLLVLCGVLPTDELTDSLGNETIWLLVAAVVIAQAISASGLATRMTGWMVSRAKTTRSLFYWLAVALFVTAFMIPSTSGRAALALPIFTAVAAAVAEQKKVVRALSILVPSVILLSAVSSYIGAGAHLITDEILDSYGFDSIGFVRWMLLGAGLGLTASLLCTELVLRLFLGSAERKIHMENISGDSLGVSAQLDLTEKKVLTVLALVILGWCTESLHGLDTVVVALLGALAITAPGVSGISLGSGLKKAPWPLLIFMAATLALGDALVESGAAGWLGDSIFSPLAAMGSGSQFLFLVLLIAISTLAHLLIQSRSARSAVLIPLIIPAAVSLGVNPVAAAFISTAAAGFCHTLTSSAKPVALFSKVEGFEVFAPADLLRLSAWLAPLHGLLILVFALVIWPLLGMKFF